MGSLQVHTGAIGLNRLCIIFNDNVLVSVFQEFVRKWDLQGWFHKPQCMVSNSTLSPLTLEVYLLGKYMCVRMCDGEIALKAGSTNENCQVCLL